MSSRLGRVNRYVTSHLDYAVPGIEPRASGMLGNPLLTEPQPEPMDILVDAEFKACGMNQGWRV